MSSADSSDSSIRVALVDDHPAVRSGIREAVTDTMDATVVAETGSADEALQLIDEKRTDVVVVDLSLADGHGFQLLENVHAQYSETRAVVFTMYQEQAYAQRALQAGASGYLMKDAALEEVVTAIRRVATGEVYLSDRMVSRVLEDLVDRNAETAQFPVDQLTDRELQVFQMLGQGFTLTEITDRLNLARKTVETYRRRLKEKLGFDSAATLMAHAIQWTDAQGDAGP